MSEPIPLIDVKAHRRIIGAEIDANIARVVDHGKWILGPEVTEFEAAAAAFVADSDVHAIGCSNGTDALTLAIQALGLPPGSAVICPAFTFVATAEAVASLGAVPIFCDVDADGFNISAEPARLAAKAAQARGLSVSGFCAVDLFGLPADYEELQAVADEFDAWLLADAAQSFGATSKGQRVGSIAEVTTTSFFPAKPLGCYGDGGMVFTKSSGLAETIRSLRVHGKGIDKYDNIQIGQNSRLDTIQAAILLPKLAILNDELVARDRIANRYTDGLGDVVVTPKVPHDKASAWAQYTILCEDRERVQGKLDDASIGNAVYYPRPLHEQSGYAQFRRNDIELTRTDYLSSRVLSLPMYPYLRDEQVDRVIETVRSAT